MPRTSQSPGRTRSGRIDGPIKTAFGASALALPPEMRNSPSAFFAERRVNGQRTIFAMLLIVVPLFRAGR